MGILRSLFSRERTKPHTRVTRNWENLPSMAMVPVPLEFSYRAIAKVVHEQASDMQLACLVGPRFTTSPGESTRDIDLLYEFADDMRLVLMTFPARTPGAEKLIVRTTFLQETGREVEARNLSDLTDGLRRVAKSKGLHTMHSG